MSTDRAGHVIHRRRSQFMRVEACALCAITLAGMLAFAASPAAARVHFTSAVKPGQNQTEHVNKDPFGHVQKGPVQIIISIDQQKLHLYSDGAHVTDTPVATGVPEHPTPLGVFDIIQKSRFHHSNIYSNAPMPYMQRITWSGVALHEGVGVGHRASHGCVRMPHEFATQLWSLTRLGTRVIIAGPELRPEEFADPHLFVHKEPPAAPVPVASGVASAKLFMTAQTTVDGSKMSDASRAESKEPDAPDPPAPAVDPNPPSNERSGAEAIVMAPADAPQTPPSNPIEMLRKASKAPIAIFISRKAKKIFVRQDFAPLFSAPITIEHPEQHLGTHVFTTLDYLDDGSTLRWNVISLPGEQIQDARRAEYEKKFGKAAAERRRDERAAKPPLVPPPPQTPQQALVRIEIPQDVIDRISQLIVPGSSLVISDQGLGDETGEGTDFIVVTR